MTEVLLARAKINDGQKERWLNWCEELKRREPEVMETLEAEGVISEACFLSPDGEYVYYFMESSDLSKASSSPHGFPIDKEHIIAREAALGTREKMTVLFNFHR